MGKTIEERFKEAMKNTCEPDDFSMNVNIEKSAKACAEIHKEECVKFLKWYDEWIGYDVQSKGWYNKMFNDYQQSKIKG